MGFFDDMVTAPKIRPALNIGCLFDIPTGVFVKGIHGEWILNGGDSTTNSLQGPGNSFKSEIINYMTFTPFSRVSCSKALVYDTENSMTYERLQRAVDNAMPSSKIIVDDPNNDRVKLVQSADILGDQWFDLVKKTGKERITAKNKEMRKIQIAGVDGKAMEMMPPGLITVDSLTEFKISETQEKIVDDNAIGESGTRTLFMSEGLAKTQLITQLPNLATQAGFYFFMVAHTGETIDMGGMFAPKPTKMTHAKSGVKHKGVPQKWTTINNNLYEIFNAKVLYNSGTRFPLYPKDSATNKVESADLNIVTLVNVRNKGGQSGFRYELIISQSEGLLVGLTMFHYLKESDRYGITGNNTSYHLDLYPECTINRVSVRGKLKEDYRLYRATEITTQLLQMEKLWPAVKYDPKYRCTPQELYDDIKKLGYDWNVLLDTRGWWCFLEDEKDLKPFLSTMDLLAMRAGEYKPYWLKK